MKAKKTVYIGILVMLISIVQMMADFSPVRVVSLLVGAFFVLYGWKIGWIDSPNVTVALGHLAIVIGCFLIAFGIYQLPGMTAAPTALEVLDLPLFWGLFTLWGGNCMIRHSYCSCVMTMHRRNNPVRH